MATISCAVVIPTLNEAESIKDLLGTLTANPRISHIIVVDDNSIDKTRAIVLECAQQDPRIQLIPRDTPRSFAGSYRDGFLLALEKGAGYIIQMDGDGSHPPASIDRMLDSLATHEFVVGSRFVQGSKTVGRTLPRRAISKLGNDFARLALETGISDMTGGFNGWNNNVLRELLGEEFPQRGFAIQIWLKQHAAKHHTWKEIPIEFKERAHGTSKFNLDIFWEGARGVMRMRKERLAERRA